MPGRFTVMSEGAAGDSMGSVEFALLEFPHTSFDGSIATALADLVGRRLVSIIDLLIVSKDDQGSLEVVELADADEVIAEYFADLDGEVMWLLSDEDVSAAAANMEAGTTGVLVVWENIWARNLRGAVGDAGGRLVIHDRLDTDQVAAAIKGGG
jgi:hypothetical protein